MNPELMMILMLADAMPLSDIVEKIKDLSIDYEKAVTLGNVGEADLLLNKLGIICTMFLQKTSNNSCADTMREIRKIQQAKNLLLPNEG